MVNIINSDPKDITFLSPVYEAETNLHGDKVKVLKLFGTAVVCDKPGINGRSYPIRIMKREAKKYMDKYVKLGRSFSELNHPRLNEKGEGKDYSVFEINLSKACALIEELKFEGNRMLIKLRVIEKHPAGEMLKALVDAGLRPGVSLRGAGSVSKNHKGILEVTEDYRLITVDVVGNPSFDDDAIMDSIYESIKTGKIQVLTEAIDIASKEFVQNVEKNNLFCGRKSLDKGALINLMESFNKEIKTQCLI